MTDNCPVNVYPVGDKFIATSETDFVHVFSPDTLDTVQKVQYKSLDPIVLLEIGLHRIVDINLPS